MKRVYFWAGISWYCKTRGIMWTAADIKVTFKHIKNLCCGTLFEDEDDDGNPCVFRIVQTRAAGDDNHVSYVPHFQFPDHTPPEADWFVSSYKEVKRWHAASRAVLAQRPDLQPPTTMQDTGLHTHTPLPPPHPLIPPVAPNKSIYRPHACVVCHDMS